MARKKETSGKREKEKQRIRAREEKKEKMELRKANNAKGKTMADMIAYIDENGNLTSTPPDPSKRKIFKQEDIQVSVPKYDPANDIPQIRTGKVAFFNDDKGYGFINDLENGQRVFVHVNDISVRIVENDKVEFETRIDVKGPVAVNVKKIS